MFTLPAPKKTEMRLDEAISTRRTQRFFADKEIDLAQLSALVRSCAGLTGDAADTALRAVPSAGALYPVQLYVASLRVQDLPKGFYRYRVKEHAFDSVEAGDQSAKLLEIGYGQRVFASAAALFVFTGMPHVLRPKYRQLSERFLHLEIGHAAQNLLLQATALPLGATLLGMFNEAEINQHLMLGQLRQQAVYMVAVGSSV